jgi:hypothetical protein
VIGRDDVGHVSQKARLFTGAAVLSFSSAHQRSPEPGSSVEILGAMKFMSVMVTVAFLDRTLRIRYGAQVGSAVYTQFSNVCMVLTAAHVVQGMQVGDRLGIRFKSDWKMVDVTGISFCKLGTDCCAIRTRTQWGEGLHEEHLVGGIALGEEVAYCGFPLNLEMEGLPGSLGWPKGFVKSAIFSGVTAQAPGVDTYLFDTINNQGFSGGPIIKRDGDKLRVVALVSGYKFDTPAPVYTRLPDGKLIETADYVVKPNSGFMIGIPIKRAVDAAKELV